MQKSATTASASTSAVGKHTKFENAMTGKSSAIDYRASASASSAKQAPNSARQPVVMKKPSSLKKKVVQPNRPHFRLSILTIAKIKRMAARVKKQYLAQHPHLLQLNQPDIQNTFQLGPGHDGKFHASEAVPLLEYVVHFFFDDVKNYVPSLINRLVQSAADDILRKCNNRLAVPRYKTVSHVTVLQIQENPGDFAVTSRCLWDDKFDNYATFTHNVRNLQIIASIYAIYFE